MGILIEYGDGKTTKIPLSLADYAVTKNYHHAYKELDLFLANYFINRY